jgi:hypothetical protein
MSLNKFKLKNVFNRNLAIARIVTKDGYKRVNLTGKSVESTVPATKLAPSSVVTIAGISDAEVQYLIDNKLPYGDRYVEVVQLPDTAKK